MSKPNKEFAKLQYKVRWLEAEVRKLIKLHKPIEDEGELDAGIEEESSNGEVTGIEKKA